MIRRSFRLGWRLGLLAGIAFAVYKVMQARRPMDLAPPRAADPWPPVPTPAPRPPPPSPAPPPPPPAEPQPVKKATKKAAKATKKAAKATKAPAPGNWVEPQSGTCPLSHPIKAKLTSRLYHLPGMVAYTRTRPDRCYATEDAARGDGFRRAKR